MTARFNAWDLPASAAFLTAVRSGLSSGLVLVGRDAARPPAVERALRDDLRRAYPEIQVILAETGQSPAACMARPLGARSSLEALLAPILDQTLLIVRAETVAVADIAAWSVFIRRFHARRAKRDMGSVRLLLDVPDSLCAPGLPTPLIWADHLGKLDLTIWADSHATPGRGDLVSGLATALAAELCGWRLDLGVALARASVDELVNPLDWVEGPCRARFGTMSQHPWPVDGLPAGVAGAG